MRKRLYISLLLLVIPFVAWASVVTGRVKPKLVVEIVVGQMRYDYLMRYADNLSDEGFKALIAEGTSCDRAMFNFWGTSTLSGLATIATGANPSVHGIIGEEWYNVTSLCRQKLLQDKNVYTVGADEFDSQFSPQGMFTSTFADELKSMSPYSKVISIAFDPLSAVIMGGHSADGAYWVNHREGHMVTDTYYMTKLPEWVEKFNSNGFAAKFMADDWKPLIPADKYKNISATDIQMKEETKLSELAQQLLLGKNKWNYDVFRAHPGANTLLKDFAIQSIIYEDLGKDENTDLLTLVFDASRHVGEKYGVQSLETEDCFYRIDKEIASILDYLKTQFKPGEVLVVVTSDHGASDQVNENNRMPNGMFNSVQFQTLINGFVGAQHGGDKRWVMDYVNNQIYLNTDLIYQSHLNLAQIENEVAGFAVQFRGVSQALTAVSLQLGNNSQGMMGQAQNSFFPKYSGHVVICMLPGWMTELDDVKSDSGTGYNYDTHVPLIFWGSMIGTRDLSNPVDMCDVAPTISSLAGVVVPAAATGRPIMEVYKERQDR